MEPRLSELGDGMEPRLSELGDGMEPRLSELGDGMEPRLYHHIEDEDDDDDPFDCNTSERSRVCWSTFWRGSEAVTKGVNGLVGLG
uniref:Uncharacterized protein n=1 Tax=Cucumis melo TaxID=3656 RepID=A0A9I9DGV6_CUCME